jgi:hypothetical protein
MTSKHHLLDSSGEQNMGPTDFVLGYAHNNKKRMSIECSQSSCQFSSKQFQTRQKTAMPLPQVIYGTI